MLFCAETRYCSALYRSQVDVALGLFSLQICDDPNQRDDGGPGDARKIVVYIMGDEAMENLCTNFSQVLPILFSAD